MGKFNQYAFNATPGFDETEVRKAFARAVPLRTLVIYCYDPRAAEIPDAVARLLGDEVFPGEIVHDSTGKRVASSTTIFPVVVAGGRAVDALRSITVAQHLFGLKNIVVVHHSQCGATTFTADGIIKAYRHEHDADISDLYECGSICIAEARHCADPFACWHAKTRQHLRLFLRHRHRRADRSRQGYRQRH